MIKMIVTDAVVSKGYENNPAIRFYDGERGLQIANFRIGKRIYDSKEEKNYRWINLTVKAFGELCERIKKMKLKEGSYINLIARYDEESWTDKGTGEKRTAPVLILDEIEYCVSAGNGQKSNQNAAGTSGGGGAEYPAPAGQSYPPQPQGGYPPSPPGQPYPPQPQGQAGTPPPSAPPMPENFTGFEGYGGGQSRFF